jgi:tRNA(Ile2)-agmatinylcytidine synthase
VWLGLDDTDSAGGGCTTWVLTEILRNLPSVDVLGYPRLVRLNPNVPFKTRGNAALGVELGHGRGPAKSIGVFGDRKLLSHARGSDLSPKEMEEVFATALGVVQRGSRWGDEGTDPALAMATRRPSEDFYWRAVREIVTPSEAVEALASVPGSTYVAYGSGQGIVGAVAALAWPAQRRTWEVITYRERSRWGTPRKVESTSVQEMETEFPETFLSWDGDTRRVLVTPHTPCPILFGIRAQRPDRLLAAADKLRSEPRERTVVFESNQGTGDHILPAKIGELEAGTSPSITGTVSAEPKVLPGGHVRFCVSDDTGEIPCLSFEPGKSLPRIARNLTEGDRVRVWGSLPWEGVVPPLKLEGIEILQLQPVEKKVANPVCPGCHRRAGSLGKGKGYRCVRCHRSFPPEAAVREPRDRSQMLGTHLPTPSARRHLSPLPRFLTPLSGNQKRSRRDLHSP